MIFLHMATQAGYLFLAFLHMVTQAGYLFLTFFAHGDQAGYLFLYTATYPIVEILFLVTQAGFFCAWQPILC